MDLVSFSPLVLGNVSNHIPDERHPREIEARNSRKLSRSSRIVGFGFALGITKTVCKYYHA